MIELQEHTGRDHAGNEVKHNQHLIRRDGVHIGYIGKLKGCKPILLPHANLTEAELKELADVCGKATGDKITEAVRPGQVVEVPKPVGGNRK